jgi:hypothetical protein
VFALVFHQKTNDFEDSALEMGLFPMWHWEFLDGRKKGHLGHYKQSIF